MKKLIAIAVVFVLVAGAAFAVDLGGTVFGHVNVLEGDSGKDGAGDPNPVKASGGMDRVRIDGSGEAGDGAFGGYIRLDNGNVDSANAWWKPIDQFKLTIGNNSDGFWGKEGVTGWSFNQMPYDSGIAINSGIWYGDGWGSSIYGGSGVYHTRYVFFGGFGANAALLEIKPLEMLGINIAIPFFINGKVEDVFSQIVAQVDLNFDFGNIALTYKGGRGYKEDDSYVPGTDTGKATTAKGPDGKDYYFDGTNWVLVTAASGTKGYDEPGALFVYYGGSFDALSIDFGLGFHFPKHGDNGNQPLGLGLGVKYAADAFGVKFRATMALPGEDFQQTVIKADLLPYFAINDNISAFLNAGLGMTMPSSNGPDKDDDAVVGWLLNPYLRVGAEWGPTFYFGFQLWSDGHKVGDDPAIVKWAVPISLMVSF